MQNLTHLCWKLSQLSQKSKQLKKNNNHQLIVTSSVQSANYAKSLLKRWSNTTQTIPIISEWDCLPYDRIPPSELKLSKTLQYLGCLGDVPLSIVTIGGLLELFPPKDYTLAEEFQLKKGDAFNEEKLVKLLDVLGYERKQQVEQSGEYARVGLSTTLFPFNYIYPFTIVEDNEKIESIYSIDLKHSKKIREVNSLTIATSGWTQINNTTIDRFRKKYRELFDGNPNNHPIYKEVSMGHNYEGIEHYFPLFFENTTTLLQYLPRDTTIHIHQDYKNQLIQYWEYIYNCYEENTPLSIQRQLKPEIRYTKPHFWIDYFNSNIDISLYNHKSNNNTPTFSTKASDAELNTFIGFIRKQKKSNHILSMNNQKNTVTAVLDLVKQSILTEIVSPANEPFYDKDTDTYFYVNRYENYLESTEREENQFSDNHTSTAGEFLKQLKQLQIGDYIVHKKHGIGKFVGLEKLKNTEFVKILYENNSSLYIPVYEYNLISFFAPHSTKENIVLDKLGENKFTKKYQAIKKDTADYAAEILRQQAIRSQAKKNHKIIFNEEEYLNFISRFGYRETNDQTKAIKATLKDQISSKPMDRIICGDVGFGKTEVAIRATFLTINNNYQAIWVAPTTILVEQHANTIKKRFSGYDVPLFTLSRMSQTNLSKTLIDKIATTCPAIIIATHRAFNKQLTFKNPALVVIDEEQKFGVKHKTTLINKYPSVDLLTMSATPIPRTLNLGLSEIKDFSLIATPPPGRRPIKTYVHIFEPSLIREAINREINRGGQVYIIHNRVRSIESFYKKIQSIVPNQIIHYIHGEMNSEEIDKRIYQFSNHLFSILISTTIIENGIDIPNANTIIVDNADSLSPIQLHQLRGRVGRSHHQAVALFIAKDRGKLDTLSVLKDNNYLGSGFQLTLIDLEKRGAGDLLGKKQSGNINTIGTALYLELLATAISNIKNNEIPQFDEVHLDFNDAAFIHPEILPKSKPQIAVLLAIIKMHKRTTNR